jgi:uncharacterized protein YbjT (DUF2867 family)
VSWYERQQERRVVVAEVRTARDADLVRLTLAINGIDAVVSPSSVFPSVDFVQGLRVTVRASDEQAALGLVQGLALSGAGDDEPEPDRPADA